MRAASPDNRGAIQHVRLAQIDRTPQIEGHEPGLG